MSEQTEYLRLTPPTDPALLRAAQSKPNGWLYEIDHEYPDNQRTPPEAIRGAWEINGEGRFTGRFDKNIRYRAIQHSPHALKAYMHAGAKAYCNKWIVEADPRAESAFPSVPESLIVGWWYVNWEGQITDLFRPNSKWIDDPENSANQKAGKEYLEE